MDGIPYPVKLGASLALLAALAWAGTAAIHLTGIAFSGSLLGLLVLAGWLFARPRDAERLPAADLLVRFLPLLFVPLLVGALGPIRALGQSLGPAAMTIVAATLSAALVSAIVTAAVSRWSSSSR